MRRLKFIVEDQIIKPDPNCDFSNLVPGSEEYLQAEFSFSPEWNGFVKAAGFYSAMGVEYEPRQLINDQCVIPSEALEKRVFKIQIVGAKGATRLRTNKVEVTQNGGRE